MGLNKAGPNEIPDINNVRVINMPAAHDILI